MCVQVARRWVYVCAHACNTDRIHVFLNMHMCVCSKPERLCVCGGRIGETALCESAEMHWPYQL